MSNRPVIAVIPIGELDSDMTRLSYESILRVFEKLDGILENTGPISTEAQAEQAVASLMEKTPDLLVIIPLRGLSAPVIEKVGLLSQVTCLVWPIQGTFALPSSALGVGALQVSAQPTILFYAAPDDPGTLEKIKVIVKAATAFSGLRKSRIGVIGKLFPNLVSCRYDPARISARLGTKVIPIAFQEIRERTKRLLSDKQGITRVEEFQQEIIRRYTVNPADAPTLDPGIQLHLVLKQIAEEQKLDGYATECWSGFPKELGLNPCLGFIEDGYALACEGDVMMCISLLIVRYMTGTYVYNGDLFDVDMHGVVTLVHCGAPASLAPHKKDVVLSPSQLAKERGFVTITCRPKLEKGPVTLFRFYGLNCDHLHLAAGELVECEQSPNLKVKIKLVGDREDFLEQCFGNHYVVAAGDIRKEIRLLCQWLGITVFET